MDRIWHLPADRDVDLADPAEAVIRAGADRLTAFPNMNRPHPHLGIREVSLTDTKEGA